MTRRNHQITLDEARPGMVLSSDLVDIHDQLLLPAGAVLTGDNIASLKRREIGLLSICIEDVPEVDEALIRQQHEQRLSYLFRKHSENDTATDMLCQFIYDFRLGTSS